MDTITSLEVPESLLEFLHAEASAGAHVAFVDATLPESGDPDASTGLVERMRAWPDVESVVVDGVRPDPARLPGEGGLLSVGESVSWDAPYHFGSRPPDYVVVGHPRFGARRVFAVDHSCGCGRARGAGRLWQLPPPSERPSPA